MDRVPDRIRVLRDQFGLQQELAPLPLENVPAILDQACHLYGSSCAFTALGETITYNELQRLSDQFAAYLQHHTGLQPGDRIAIQLPNLLQYPVVAFAALKIGLVLVNTNPLYTPRELKGQLANSGARAIITLSHLVPELLSIIKETDVEYVIPTGVADLLSPVRRQMVIAALRFSGKKWSFDRDALLTLTESCQVDDFRRTLDCGANLTIKRYEASRDELALLQYTGGTTGISKGAMLSHANLIANTVQSASLFGYAGIKPGSEVVIAPLPLYHVFAFVVSMVMMVHLGSHTVLVPDPRNIPSLVSVLKKYPFSIFLGLNTLFSSLLKYRHFCRVDFSHLKLTASGGMALTESVAKEWQECTGSSITEGYGLTETSPVVAVNIPGNEVVGSVGVAVPSTELKIANPEGMALPVEQAGELWVRGPQVMKGYWNSPQETAQCLDAEGWFRTGDIAKVSSDGRLWILDRMKDMVIVSGFNVYPNEVESVVSSHPDVAECAVIGVPDPKTGEAVKLFVVSTNPKLTAEELIHWCHQQLTSYKIPKQVEFVKDLPKSNVGKVLRAKLRTEKVQEPAQAIST